MTRLSVNLNKVALLRNQRAVGYPDPVAAGRAVLQAGAHGLTVHPRPDERHVRRADVPALAALIRDEGWADKGVEFNIEGNPFEDYLDLVRAVRPDQATLVPDAPDQSTSDHGWDVAGEAARLERLIGEIKGWGVRVSLFMDPDPAAMARAAALGADRVELYTGPYAEAFDAGAARDALARYAAAAAAALEAGLGVNAGHDLTTANLGPLRRALPRLDEVSIGHAFIADALWHGFAATTRAYLDALGEKPATEAA